MKLFYSRNPNPRLAVAVARHLAAAVDFEWASPFAPGQSERFRPLNPNLSRAGDDEPDMIRWISWGKENFVRACDIVHFERGTKQRYALGPIDDAQVKCGLDRFDTAAAILEAELSARRWLLGDAISYADFRMATFLPFNDVAGLPLERYPFVRRWYRRLEKLDAWRDPFAGLDAPELPPLPR